MKGITTFLMFNDQTEEAVRFYVSVFPGAKLIQLERMEADGGPIPRGGILQAVFEIAGQTFFATDGGPHFTFSQGMSLYVHCETQAEIDALWDKLPAGGGHHEPCGWLVDRFGVSWQIVPTNLDDYLLGADRARAMRVFNAMLTMHKLDRAALDAAAKG